MTAISQHVFNFFYATPRYSPRRYVYGVRWLSSLTISSGDLGVQRGLLRWCLSLHSPDHSFGTFPEKSDVSSTLTGEDAESSDSRNANALDGIPPPLTPSTENSLKQTNELERQHRPLPPGLSVPVLKSRLAGKKIK
jgi:DNA-3-methyladenine glycosylase II